MSDIPTICDVCQSPVMYGSRHHQCGSFVMSLERDLTQAKAELSTLRAECERLKEDAERYRWLCDEAYIWGDSKIYGEDVQIEPAALWILGSSDLTKPQIDAAIDKGRKDQP